MSTSVTRNGITLYFAADHVVGQYANDDYYIVAPSGLTIIEIDPPSIVVASRDKLESPYGTETNTVINGVMVNPQGGTYPGQGFDSGATGYVASLNKARPGGNDLSVGNPMVVAAGSSILAGRSHPDVARPALTDAAVFTVVASAPAAGSFRPPYSGTDKTHYWNKSDINYDKLSDKAAVSGAPEMTLAGAASWFSKVWIDFYTSNDGRYTHASNNQPEYGGEMARIAASALSSLLMSATNAEKEAAAIRYIQYGIDIYGIVKGGGNWFANGGHNIGRKAPLVVAAICLNDSNILAYCDKAVYNRFSEDHQAFTVNAASLLVVPYNGDNRGRRPYIEAAATFNAGSADINTGDFIDLDRVTITTTGTLPTEFNTSDVYIVDYKSAGVVWLKTTAAGAAIVPTSVGTGTHKLTHVGVAEWGEQHDTSPTRDSSGWYTYYRDVCYRESARIAMYMRCVTGAKDAWNNNVFFDYGDIVMRVVPSGFSAGFQNFYSAYRYGGGSPPLTPSGLSATEADFNSVLLSWTDNSGGVNEESYYEIQLSDSSGSGFSTYTTVPAQVGTGPMSHRLTGLVSGRTKYCRIRAVNSADVSAFSSTVNFTTPLYGHVAPTRAKRPIMRIRY